MSLRKYIVQYIGSCLRLPELERDVTLVATYDGKRFVPEERLDAACRELADFLGTCPYDLHYLRCETWDEYCDEHCRGDGLAELMAGCWKKYFAENAPCVEKGEDDGR